MTELEQLPIVVGIDGFETGRRVLDWALREAQARHCAVQVVHAWVFDPAADYFTETSSQWRSRHGAQATQPVNQSS
jgi:nucleotide-binding universal stress UspA family protein